ncbi:cytochrome p450 85a1 [Quercus suber]|uniref:Cytochrome p450 85a1 n=1 Tax=Quercus suber TaxID=58331 RepID=A0AAW0LM13_QUESU
MAFYVAFRQIIIAECDLIYEAFDKAATAALSLPINIPGKSYYQGLQTRKNIHKILRQIVEERKASRKTHNDMFAELIGNEKSRYRLTEEQVFNQIFTILYSGYETVSVTTMMAIKYLHDHPKALQELKVRIFLILLIEVILETSSLATIVNGLLGKITQDVELNGFLIPKGWRIYVFTRELNYDPVLYPEPSSYIQSLEMAGQVLGVSQLLLLIWSWRRAVSWKGTGHEFFIPKGWRIYVFTRDINYDPLLYPKPFTFNPWRWMDKSLESHSYCFLFGAGGRLCPGKELGMVKVSTFLHYFVTKYRWEEVGEVDIIKFPRVEVPSGLHVRVSKH